MKQILDIVLLLALPASGKSEVRCYLKSLDPAVCTADFHLGPTVQLDDFLYVHFMRSTDNALRAAGSAPAYFDGNDKPFKDPRDWGTLIHLLNEDYADLKARRIVKPASAAEHLLCRIDESRAKVGAPPLRSLLTATVREKVTRTLENQAREMLVDKHTSYPDTLNGKTLIIEFARGGPHGAALPLTPPFGYAYSLAQLSAELLERATILYVCVTPQESRRKNEARADPNDPGSILHHGVPANVMMNDYGCDDMAHLLATSGRPGRIRVEAHGRTYWLPTARLDNRTDMTSFVRAEPKAWGNKDVQALHAGLKAALGDLYNLAQRNLS